MMNLPWIIGAIGAVLYFAVWEGLAFRWPSRFNTLSRAIAGLGARWPLSIALAGLFAGILLAHFYWPWAANPLGVGGG